MCVRVCACVVGVIVKRPVLPPCAVDIIIIILGLKYVYVLQSPSIIPLNILSTFSFFLKIFLFSGLYCIRDVYP